jgi:hypothetical protein
MLIYDERGDVQQRRNESLAFGLAFGLGGQEAAARFIEKTRDQMNSHHR